MTDFVQCETCDGLAESGKLHECTDHAIRVKQMRIALTQASALRDIADVMWAQHKLEQAKFDKLYPTRAQTRDVTLTRVPTSEDRIKQEQGGDTGETITEWITFRETHWANQKEESPEGVTAGGSGSTGGDSPTGGDDPKGE